MHLGKKIKALLTVVEPKVNAHLVLSFFPSQISTFLKYELAINFSYEIWTFIL